MDELDSINIFLVNGSRKELLSQNNLFGQGVSNKFDEMSEDI